jgi:phospholipase C
VLKFIEWNWFLKPLTGRSRDNLPNLAPTHVNPYVPDNMPAISDLFEMFDFSDHGGDDTDQPETGRGWILSRQPR